ncbi:MAG: glycosyltransferase [Planctomycetes bacterium]|nr:glycosyltransferase [Planctomycetota bacterium]
MSDSADSAERLGLLLVITDSANPPGNPENVFREVQVVRPDAGETARGLRPDCIRADASGARLAHELGKDLGVSIVLSADAAGEFLKEAACVLARNEAAAARGIAQGADPARVVTLHERVDRQRFSPDGAAARGGEGRPKLLSFDHDNIPRMLEACTIASKHHPDLKLVHLGAGNWIEQRFAERRTNESAEALPSWFRWADALLMPANGDPGIAPAQALACGTPCIVSDTDVMREFVTDRWDGLLVNPTNPGSIASAIDAIADPAMQARLAAPARTASESFDAAVIDRREAGVYQWLLQKKHPLVSVVLPTRNRARLIEAAVDNVLKQDYPNLELIVVNDGSTDDTRARLDALKDPRLTTVHLEHVGLPTALNKGFERAQGEFWTWTSDDNAYRPGALQALARELQLNPDVGMVYADMLVRNDVGTVRIPRLGPPEALSESCCTGACFMYRASVARAVGEYDPAFACAEDYDYWLRMRRRTNLLWLHRVLYEYGDTADSLTHTRFLDVQRARLRLLEREFGATPEWPARQFRQFCRDASDGKNAGHTIAALRYAWRALRLRPGSATAWRTLGRALTPGPLLRLTRRMRGLNDS